MAGCTGRLETDTVSVSGLQAINERLQLLDEIGRIMDSIETIALIETQHNRTALDSQQSGIRAMQVAATQFVQGYLPEHPDLPTAPKVILAIGSERGFCGDFNAHLVATLQGEISTRALQDYRIIAIGYRLWNKLRDDPHTGAVIAGASVAAELEGILTDIVTTLVGLNPPVGFESVWVLRHDEASREIVFEPLLAELLQPNTTASAAYPPLINLAPAALLKSLVTEYVYARLHYLLTSSFVAENEQRVQHLRGALDHIDEQREALGRKQNQLRQEQITEELEIILLNTVEAP